MSNKMKKSALYDLMARHSDFNFDTFIQTAVRDEHYDDWNAYCLPMHYSDCETEYNAIRDNAALFDASPMKKYRFQGEDAGVFLDGILTASVSSSPVMKASYGLMCDEEGFLYDDGIVIKLADDDYLMLTSYLDLTGYFDRYNDFKNLTYHDESEAWSGLVIQGPKSCSVLQHMGFEGIENLAPFHLQWFQLGEHKFLIGRLGFTGDLGYEIWFDTADVNLLQQTVINAENELDFKLRGYGLDALQVCRIEAGMIVPGWDTAGEFKDPMSERTPFELTLGWNVRLKRDEDFVGKKGLIEHKKSGARYEMRGCLLEAVGPVEFGQTLYADLDGQKMIVGSLASVVWHPIKKLWIGFVSVQREFTAVENTYVCIGDNSIACQFHALPFINLERRSKVPAVVH